VSSLEVVGAVLEHCHDNPAGAADIAWALQQHSSEVARSIGRELTRFVEERANQIKDIEQIRRTSPLQPGTRLILSGGYSAAYGRAAVAERSRELQGYLHRVRGTRRWQNAGGFGRTR
jgi:hypothetical protein